MRTTILACLSVALAVGCGGSAVTGTVGDGGGLGGAQNVGGSQGTGGAPQTGGSPGIGGSPGTGGVGGGINCALVGCAMPPLCATGCTEVCGCCPCGEGSVETRSGISYVCVGGCYAPGADAGGGCDYLGQHHPPGTAFAAGDACNTCTCGASGQAACTEKACTCDPANETHQRSYLGTATQCMAMKFTCAANTTMFHNACGCGCEQDPSCPEWYNCMPPSPCDPQQIHTDCPFSGIAY
jgi:hypothetical protein